MSPTVDDIEIVRISELFNPRVEEGIFSLSVALARHIEETSDPNAILAKVPLSGLEAASMMDSADCVSGYRSVQLSALCGLAGNEVDAFIAASLCTAPLRDFEWEAVWALGKTIVVYARGRLA